MEHQENLELYLNLSRRELQILCKSNNLPANRSHTELAKSLASFFKKKNGSPSLALDTRPKESENLSEDKSKDFIGAYERTHFLEPGSNKASLCMKEKKSDNKHFSLTGNLATISSHVDHQASQDAYNTVPNVFCPDTLVSKNFDCFTSKTGYGIRASIAADIHQIKKDSQLSSGWHMGETFNKIKKYPDLRNNRQIVLSHAVSKSRTHNSVANTIPREHKSPRKGGYLPLEEISIKETPSFEFFVMSEDGINLHVDLNSSPSEWINGLKDELSINLKMQDSKSSILPARAESFSEEANAHIKISSFENIGSNLYSNTVDGNSGCTTSTLSWDSENCQSVAPQPDATFVSTESSVLTSGSIPVKMPGYLDRNIPSCATPLSNQKHMAFDNSSCPGDVNAFSEDLVDASSGRKKSNVSVLGISVGPVSVVGLLSSEGTRNPEQVECSRLKIDDDLDTLETNGLQSPLASIPEENNFLKSDGTEKIISTSDMVNLEHDNVSCNVSIERGPTIGPTEVAADHKRSSNFCEDGADGQLIPECSATEAHPNARSVDYTLNHHSCSFERSVGKDPVPVLNHELGESTQAEEIETSECSRSQKSSQNNSKRSLIPEFHEEFHTKRHHSEVENKGGMMMNLRSSRTSAKEAICEQVVRPRRSTRLLEGSF